MEKVIVEDPAAEAAARIAAVVTAGGHVALSGGSTPRAAFERLAAMDLDWSRCTLWFGDDRAVPPDDENSNYRMAREALLDPLGSGAPQVHRIEGELGADEAAERYESELRTAFGDSLPRLDLNLLGIGLDGHTASLFPNQPSLEERERWAVAVPEAGQPPWVPRVTMTLPVINASAQILFLIKGADKAEPVARAFGGEPGADTPASLVRAESGTLTVVMDAAAAALL
jgi:6-phosphogluconolactonase